jgi:hypothetical protein
MGAMKTATARPQGFDVNEIGVWERSKRATNFNDPLKFASFPNFYFRDYM